MTEGGFDIGYTAGLARIGLSEEERRRLAPQLSSILRYVEKLEELPVDRVEPTYHPLELGNAVRSDVAGPSMDPGEALELAPETVEGLFRTPRIVE